MNHEHISERRDEAEQDRTRSAGPFIRRVTTTVLDAPPEIDPEIISGFEAAGWHLVWPTETADSARR